jgi:FdhD protein
VSELRHVRVRNWRLERAGADPAGAATDPGVFDVSDDSIASEVPVALTYNRMSHVVMMATPLDLEDFAVGFSTTEGLVGALDDILAVRVIPRTGGIELALNISEDWFDRLATRRRNMVGRTGCGLCGAENIEQALRDPSPVARSISVSSAALQRAVTDLENHQPLQAKTGATHGAAWCALDGRIIAVREDVGRHNALDKLIGSLVRGGYQPDAGFVLVSSRASYEMVYKTAAAGIELIMAVSAPTTLAVEFAERSGVTLVGFARPGRHNIYTFPERIMDGGSNDPGS